jgi:hypothetical protein
MTKRICDRCEKDIPREAVFHTLHVGLFMESQVPAFTGLTTWPNTNTMTRREYVPHGVTKAVELCADCIGVVRDRVLAATGKID